MSVAVYRPYAFREPLEPDLEAGIARLGVRFEDALGPHTAGILTLLALRIDGALLDRAPGVRIVSNVAVGFDNVDLEEATRRGVMITNTPDVLTGATADLAWALLLAAARRVAEGDRYVRAGRFVRWDFDLMRGREVHGRTLGILGAGRIGQAVGRRGVGFGMRILYVSRQPKPDFERDCSARRVELETLMRESDFVSINVPLTARTRHLVGARELAWMKPDAILVNTARGPVVDEAALAEALERGRPGGAGLDVYEHEPQVHPTLLRLDNVVLCPHVGSATDETRARMVNLAVRNLLAGLRGEVPPNCVNARELGLVR